MIPLTPQQQHARERLCLPLDNLNSLEEVRERIIELKDYVGIFKVGKGSYTRFGPDIIRLVQSYDTKIFLDLKYHDIPATVKDACKAAAQLGVYIINIHASGGLEMMKAALEGIKEGTPQDKPRPYLIGVTVLTSIDDTTLNQQLHIPGSLNEHVLHLAQLTCQAGLDGIVCSAQDLIYIKPHLPKKFMYITPGIQGITTSAGTDQARITTPSGAIAAGSSILVVGRAITTPTTREARQHTAYEILQDMSK